MSVEGGKNLYGQLKGINKDHPNENKWSLFTSNSELVTERESATIPCIWQRPKGRQESSRVNKRLQVCSDWRLLAQRTWRQDVRRGASYMTDLGSIFGFLQLVLIWKWGQKFKETVSHRPSPDHSRTIAVEIMGLSLLSCVLALVCMFSL